MHCDDVRLYGYQKPIVKKITLSLLISIILLMPCAGQAPSTPDQTTAAEKVKALIYQPRQKRDPFRSLVMPKKSTTQAAALPKFRPAGLPGLLVSQVAVIGIASNNNDRLAVLQSTEGKGKVSYFAKVGDKLYNGFISEIDVDKVMFTEELVNFDGKATRKTLTKKLYADM
jgi:Tfp pilus assembly protein PilP